MKLILKNAIRVTELENMKNYINDLKQVSNLYKSGKITDSEKRTELKKISDMYLKNEQTMERQKDQWEDTIKEFERIKNEFSKVYRANF